MNDSDSSILLSSAVGEFEDLKGEVVIEGLSKEQGLFMPGNTVCPRSHDTINKIAYYKSRLHGHTVYSYCYQGFSLRR